MGQSQRKDWINVIDAFVRTHNSAVHSAHSRTPHQALFGWKMHNTTIDNNIDDDVNNDDNNNDNNDSDSDNDDDNGDNNNDVNVGRPIAGGAFGVVYKDDSTVHSACPFLYTASSMFMTHRIPPSTIIMM